MNTKFSSSESLVIQINPLADAAEVIVNQRAARRKQVFVYIPRMDGTQIFCPLNYFQDSFSLREQWFYNDAHQKTALDGIDNLREVVISEKKCDLESVVNISDLVKCNLYRYFYEELAKKSGFDCHAFACFLFDLKCIPEAPCFTWSKREPNIGDVVSLSDDGFIPDSIKHWAIFLGGDLYLSKFGKSSGSKQPDVEVMDISGMHTLYGTSNLHVAIPSQNAPKWDENF